VPRHLVCRVSPTVLAEALPINANDKARLVLALSDTSIALVPVAGLRGA
jgi:hypothetical protein